MPIYKQFDVVVVPFPFTNSNRTKKRPALVLSDRKSLAIDKSILAMIICEAVKQCGLERRKTASLHRHVPLRFGGFTDKPHFALNEQLLNPLGYPLGQLRVIRLSLSI